VSEWSASRPCRFTSGERAPGTHLIGGWVDPRAGLDDMEKWKFLLPPGLELRPLGRPARSQSLYRLRYPGSCGRVVRKESRRLVLPITSWILMRSTNLDRFWINSARFRANGPLAARQRRTEDEVENCVGLRRRNGKGDGKITFHLWDFTLCDFFSPSGTHLSHKWNNTCMFLLSREEVTLCQCRNNHL
jgi:hypothetical protein